MTRDNASAQCRRTHNQADLTVVSSIEEHNFILNLFPANTYAAWLGCRDVKDTGIWTCLDDPEDSLHYFVESNRTSRGFWNWESEQPNGQQEDCLVIGEGYAQRQRSIKWHDWPCSTLFQSICEIPISTLTTDDNEIGFADSLGIFIKFPPAEPVNCPADITKTNDESPVTWMDPATDATTRIYASTHEPGDVFPLGVTEVTYTFVDERSGEMSFCSFHVEVVDNHNKLNSDQFTGPGTTFTVAVILGVIMLIVIILFVGITIHLCIRIKSNSKRRRPSEQLDNYYITPIRDQNEPTINGHNNSVPTRAAPIKVSSENTLPAVGEDTYEELKDRPPSGAYTDLSLHSVSQNSMQHQYSVPKF
ncbi:uncharacterized protein [Amphiura filiformis]|uniref:uncharacterized protein n=1 Tax=Amphiura filiformis TaxID=82378 RepID=UPI003B20EAEA